MADQGAGQDLRIGIVIGAVAQAQCARSSLDQVCRALDDAVQRQGLAGIDIQRSVLLQRCRVR